MLFQIKLPVKGVIYQIGTKLGQVHITGTSLKKYLSTYLSTIFVGI